MKTLIASFTFIMLLNLASAQTGTTNSTSSRNENISPEKDKNTIKQKQKNKTSGQKKENGVRRDAERPEAPYSKERPVPKDKSGKDSNKVGDSPKFRK
jgi:hypothetical protein